MEVTIGWWGTHRVGGPSVGRLLQRPYPTRAQQLGGAKAAAAMLDAHAERLNTQHVRSEFQASSAGPSGRKPSW